MRTIVLLVALVGCAGASKDQLLRRASFDLACDPKSLTVIELDRQTSGVMGCGQRVTYVESCDGPRENMTTSCTWVLNKGTTVAAPAKP